jgi:hypothetical protein
MKQSDTELASTSPVVQLMMMVTTVAISQDNVFVRKCTDWSQY